MWKQIPWMQIKLKNFDMDVMPVISFSYVNKHLW